GILPAQIARGAPHLFRRVAHPIAGIAFTLRLALLTRLALLSRLPLLAAATRLARRALLTRLSLLTALRAALLLLLLFAAIGRGLPRRLPRDFLGALPELGLFARELLELALQLF